MKETCFFKFSDFKIITLLIKRDNKFKFLDLLFFFSNFLEYEV